MPYKDLELRRKKSLERTKRYILRHPERVKVNKFRSRLKHGVYAFKKCSAGNCDRLAERGAWTYCREHSLVEIDPKRYTSLKAQLHKAGLNVGNLTREYYLMFYLINKSMEELRNGCYQSH